MISLTFGLVGTASCQFVSHLANTTAVNSTQQASVPVTIAATGVPSSFAVVTQGVSGLDFSLIDAGNCQQPILTAGQVCNVNIAYKPLAPGDRFGAVVITDGSGAVLARQIISARGTGGLGILLPGTIKTVAGTGDSWIYRGDGVDATTAPIFLPMGGSVDAAGNLYIADSNNNRIRRVDASTGLISTVAGNGNATYQGDGGPATQASLSIPAAVVLDGAGDIYIADSSNSVIRRVDAITGVITTIAGTGNQPGSGGDNGPATAAKLSSPSSLAIAPDGALLIGDTGNHVIRRVDPVTQIITTIAGNGTPAFAGDGGPATSGSFNKPWGMAFAADGSLYIADDNNNRIRRIDAAGVLSTVAGTGARGLGGDNGPAISAVLNNPVGLAVDTAGNIYIADTGNSRLRVISAVDGTITTVAGNNSGTPIGDGGLANAAGLYGPYSVFLDGAGNIYIADLFHNTIRRIASGQVTLNYPVIREGRTSIDPQIETFANIGNAPFTINALHLVSNTALDPATTKCEAAQQLKVNQTCTLGVQFAPTKPGDSVTGSLQVESDAGNTPAVINVQGKVLTVDPTVVTLSSSLNPAQADAAITFTVQVTSVGITPTGNVTLKDGNTVIATQPLNAAAITTFSTSSLTPGNHILTASYEGDDNNASGVSDPLTQVIKQPSTTVLTSTPNPSIALAPVVFTVSVTVPNGTATGTVILTDSGNAIGAGTLNGSGTTTIRVTTLTGGSHSIVASYSGDNSNFSSQSAALTQTVNAAATTTALVSSSPVITLGNAVTFTATVSSSGTATPTGNVQFRDGAAVIGTVPVDGNSTARFDTTSLAVGPHSIVATYVGDVNSATSTSAVLTQTVQPISTTTLIASSANPVDAGATLTLSATIKAAAATSPDAITGQVRFSDGATVLVTVPVINATVEGASATLAITTLPLGSHTLTATYIGDTNFSTSTSTALTQNVQQATTTTTISASTANLVAGKPVTFSVKVTGTGAVPTGAVTFRDGAATLGTATLDAQGNATFTTSSLSVATHDIFAIYAGDTNDRTSQSATISITVQQATTTTSIAASPNPVLAGLPLTLTSSVTGNGGIPTGHVTFMEGATVVGGGDLSASAQVVITTTALPAGIHTLTAVYSGDANDQGSTSVSVNVTVEKANTTTTITSSANPATQGDPVTLTASVRGNGTAPTGTVNFLDAGAIIGTGTLSGGSTTFTTAALSAGVHSLTAQYVGDANNAESASVAISQRIQATPITVLTSSLNPAAHGAAVILTATVSAGTPVPTGTITFRDGAAVLSTVSLNGGGVATLSVNTLSVGSHTIIAVYSGDQVYAVSTSQPLSENIVQTTTQTALSTSTPTVTVGSNATLNVAVTGNGGPPAGSVSLIEGGNTVATTTLSPSGTAVFSIPNLAVSPHTFTAVYAGDSNNTASTSSPLQISIVQAITSISVGSNSNPSIAGLPIVFTASLGNTALTPGGSITFREGATVIGSVAVVNGSASITNSTLNPGQHVIVASYSGDTNNAAANSPPFSQNIQQATAAVALSSSKNPSRFRDTVVLTASVATNGGVPTGVISFQDGAATIGTAALNGSGVAVFSTSTLSVAQHSIVATYAGDANHPAAQSIATVQQVQQTTTTSISVSSNTILAGLPLHLSGTVIGEQAVSITGNVRFVEGGTLLCTGVTSPSGAAGCDISTLSVGTHTLSASYSGDAASEASTSAAITVVVQSASTTVTLGSSANPSTSGTSLTLIANVAGKGGSVSGTVNFMDGSILVGTAPLNASGTATISTSSLSPGTHILTAMYSGDAGNLASVSSPLQQSVLQTTFVVLRSSINPSLALDTILLTVSVTNNGVEKPTGNVVFSDGTATLASVALDATGSAAFAYPAPTAGSHLLNATYSGDTKNFAGTAPSVTQIVQKRPTSLQLTASSTSLTGNQQLTLISVLAWSTPSGRPILPGGLITFYTGTTLLGTSMVDSTGVGTFTYVPKNTGANIISATYSGDDVYLPSASGPTTVTVDPSTPFTFSLSQTALSFSSKQHSNVTATLSSFHSFSDTIVLGCLGLPVSATCTFNKDRVDLTADGAQTVQLTIDTGSPLTAGSTARLNAAPSIGSRESAGSTVLASILPVGMLLSLWIFRRRKIGCRLLIALFGMAIAIGVSGCGGLNINGTPPGTYTFKVTASGVATGITQSVDVTLTVK